MAPGGGGSMASRRDAGSWGRGIRWCRCSQPPATGGDPAGIKRRRAGPRRERRRGVAGREHGVAADRWHPSGMRDGGGRDTGGVAALNHRLQDVIPPGSRGGRPMGCPLGSRGEAGWDIGGIERRGGPGFGRAGIRAGSSGHVVIRDPGLDPEISNVICRSRFKTPEGYHHVAGG